MTATLFNRDKSIILSDYLFWILKELKIVHSFINPFTIKPSLNLSVKKITLKKQYRNKYI
jgi:hypothetical protein